MFGSKVLRFIASRYLLSKKSHSIINLLSIITIVAIVVPTAAMMILLSVHNGFEEFVGKMWSNFDSDIIIEPKTGKYFNIDEFDLNKIEQIDGIKSVSYYISDEALLRYKERQVVATIRGIDTNYVNIVPLENIVAQGNCRVEEGALVGMGVAYNLGLKVNLSDNFSIIAPSPKSYDPFNPSSVYNIISVELNGIFTLDAESDSEFIFLSLEQAQSLFSKNGQVTTLAIDLFNKANVELIVDELKAVVGDDFEVKDIYDQNIIEYKLIQSEKIAIYLIIFLVLIIASFTLVGAIIMLILEKQDNMLSLKVLGLTNGDIRSIFVWQGVFISLIGAFGGIILGLGVALAQQYFNFIPINGASLLIDSYPCKVLFKDIILVVSSVLIVTFVITWTTNKVMIKN